ncbi:MFS transporter [Embleya sp. NPDC127516]|uniref:MFS transporter n=1 Tax=Embleya sp. NPDC127516 TaxID=3363990 RepID=UPI0038299E58
MRGRDATAFVTCAATLLALMNYTAPMAVLPDMAASFDSSAAGKTWILNGIAVGLAATLLTSGSLADNFGRRRVFSAGLVALAAASLVCAAAPSTGLFVLGRFAQGTATAAVIAAGLGALANAHPDARARTRATGIWGAMLGAGIALGPLASALAEALGDWRLFYVGLAASSAVLAVAAVVRMSESRAQRPRRVDLWGMITLTAGVALLITTLTFGREGWTRPETGWLGAATAVMLTLFVVVENRRREPMLDMALFADRAFVAATTGAFANGLGTIALMSYLPTLLQTTMGLSPLHTAEIYTAWAGTSFVVALAARRLAGRVSPGSRITIALVMAAVGALAMLGACGADSWPRLLPGLFIAGISSGVMNATLAGQAVATVPPDRTSMGSGANNTARYIGSALGVAIVVTVSTGSADAAEGADAALWVSAAMSAVCACLVLATRLRHPGRAEAAPSGPGRAPERPVARSTSASGRRE